jgi:hypothetical protein
VDVIQFPQWRVFFFLDEQRTNVVRKWLDEQGVSDPDRSALQALIDICEYSGPEALSSCTLDLENGYYALLSKHHKGGIELGPVFCHGPFGENEITLLAGARWDSKSKRLRPFSAVGIAEENLEILREDRTRRRRERVT